MISFMVFLHLANVIRMDLLTLSVVLTENVRVKVDTLVQNAMNVMMDSIKHKLENVYHVSCKLNLGNSKKV